MRKIIFAVLVACAGAASAQNLCPHASEIQQAQALGTWRAEFEDLPGPAMTLVLARHETYAESLSGTLERGGQRLLVAGDMEDGEFTLEESADGEHIAATWLGEVVEGTCGREIRGTWSTDEAGRDARPFILRKN